MKKFDSIWQMAKKRKGGDKALQSLLNKPKSNQALRKLSDDRYLSMMTKCIFQAGFSWKVVHNKWPDFEKAFWHFDIDRCVFISEEDEDTLCQNKGIVRNRQKIRTVAKNAKMIADLYEDYQGFGDFLASWPKDDFVGLLFWLKKHGSRLGGNSAQYFLRFIGYDGLILSKDVTHCLMHIGLDIKAQPTAKRDLVLIQDCFNHYQQQTGLPYTHLSQIMAYAIGENYESTFIKGEIKKWREK